MLWLWEIPLGVEVREGDAILQLSADVQLFLDNPAGDILELREAENAVVFQ
jgi:hypothetical protein